MHKTVLGGKFTLFTCDKHGSNVQNLILLAHSSIYHPWSKSGILRRIAGTHSFTIPIWTTLYFYTPHGYDLMMPKYDESEIYNIDGFMLGEFPPLEAILPGETVPDYSLVHELPFPSDEHIYQYLNTSRFNPGCSYFDQHPFRIYDIIIPTSDALVCTCLKELIYTLYVTGHVYPRIHCLFCRYVLGAEIKPYVPGYDNPPFSQSQNTAS
ncbi:hypothetical protein NX722_12425 [Endozoicomonas gorgoniicola]|uniref:Putative adhesin Stv domain-containing protein n=1 Tax=Endozoicomonas gorgoniicola TaxID=1234144 RepID=A0ABT3MVP4_9GAMM|nr:hypothetical protein [Endozoicomonas gorgoniicola]MCW7553425.1 hypothetical protein [Endozoicomonas gorgoniicola]